MVKYRSTTHHMSMGVEYSVEPSRTSGGRYHRVTTSLEYVLVGTDLARARPGHTTVTEEWTSVDSKVYFCLETQDSTSSEHLSLSLCCSRRS